MIKRIMFIVCDQCGAEGPSIVSSEDRPQLYRDAREEGWLINDQGKHICAECLKPPIQSPLSPEQTAQLMEKFHQTYPALKITGAPSSKRFDRKEPQP